MRCALYFGSFNPLHIGHVAIAKYVLEQKDIDSFRFVLSPHNPLKEQETLKDANERLAALEASVKRLNNPKVKVCNIEFHLPKPLYTYNTLSHLKKSEPNTEFILIIGGDNLAIIERWHKWKELLSQFEVWVYPRNGVDTKELCKKYDTIYLDAPQIDISSTEIREKEKEGIDMSSYIC